jgi:hypothetical protein
MRGYSTHLGVLEGNAPETFWHVGPGRVSEPRFFGLFDAKYMSTEPL